MAAANNALSDLPRLASTKTQIGQLLVGSVDMYVSRQITEANLREYIAALKQNCCQLMLDDTRTALDRGVLKIVGKKRARIISAILSDI